jgi:hypothetical protein
MGEDPPASAPQPTRARRKRQRGGVSEAQSGRSSRR